MHYWTQIAATMASSGALNLPNWTNAQVDSTAAALPGGRVTAEPTDPGNNPRPGLSSSTNGYYYISLQHDVSNMFLVR